MAAKLHQGHATGSPDIQNGWILSGQSSYIVGRESVNSITTRYWLDGPGIESRWEAIFSAPVRTYPGAQPASYTIGTGSFPGVKRPERGHDHPPLSSAEIKERVELYTSTPPLGLRGVSRLNFNFTFHILHQLLGLA